MQQASSHKVDACFKFLIMKFFVFTFLILCILACGDAVTKKEYTSPDILFAELFVEVQTQQIFEDSKTFADAIPKFKAKEILLKFTQEKNKPSFDLANFVNQNFTFTNPPIKIENKKNLEEYLLEDWKNRTRKPFDDGGSLIPTRNNYLSVSKYSNELNYGSNYYSILGLLAAKQNILAKNIAVNAVQLVQDFGYMPAGNRTYMFGRSNPPFLSFILEEISKTNPEILKFALPQLTQEYQFWMSAQDKDENLKQKEAQNKKELAYKRVVFLEKNNLLNRYYDPLNTPRVEVYKEDLELKKINVNYNRFIFKNLRAASESDWEHSSRWISNLQKTQQVNTLQIAPVDLNALLYHLEKTLAKAYKANEQPDYARSFENLAKKRKIIFDTYFWDDTKGFYFDYDFLNQKRSNVYALSGIFPLFVGLASENQATKIAELLEKSFLKPGGLSTTLNVTGLINDAPYGRADLQWIAISSLRKYNKNALADKIKARWLKTNIACFSKSGEILEFYNVLNPEKNGVNKIINTSKIDKTSGVLYKLLKE